MTDDQIGRRIQTARETYGMTQTALAEWIGKTRAAVSQYENGSNAPGSPVVERLALLFDVAPEWFIYGVGLGPRPPERPVTIPEIDVRLLPRSRADLARYRSDRQWAAPAGFLKQATPAVDPAQLAVIYVHDDAMSPAIQYGDHVLLDLSRRDNNKNRRSDITLVAELSGSRHWFCRFVRDDANHELHFDNTAYPTRKVKRSEVVVIGRVIGVLGRLFATPPTETG